MPASTIRFLNTQIVDWSGVVAGYLRERWNEIWLRPDVRARSQRDHTSAKAREFHEHDHIGVRPLTLIGVALVERRQPET